MIGPLVLVCALVSGGSPKATFDQAIQAYEKGNYPGAIAAYEQLIQDGIHNPAVFYNLGNAYYRSGRLGPAIANYERALYLDPGFEQASENLAQCVRETKRQLGRPLPPEWEQSLLFWHYNLAPRTILRLAALCWIAVWGYLIARLWRPLPYFRLTAACLILMCAALGASAWTKTHPQALAVASRERVAARYGIGEQESVRFELFDGDRVTVDARRKGWARVTTPDGQRGWVNGSDLTFVGPPFERPAEDIMGNTDTETRS